MNVSVFVTLVKTEAFSWNISKVSDLKVGVRELTLFPPAGWKQMAVF